MAEVHSHILESHRVLKHPMYLNVKKDVRLAHSLIKKSTRFCVLQTYFYNTSSQGSLLSRNQTAHLPLNGVPLTILSKERGLRSCHTWTCLSSEDTLSTMSGYLLQSPPSALCTLDTLLPSLEFIYVVLIKHLCVGGNMKKKKKKTCVWIMNEIKK